MRARAEAFGAWVRVSDGTLVAVDRAAARRMGVEGGELWDGEARGQDARPAAPLEVHVAVTSRCGAGCSGCYLDARPDGEAPPFEELARRITAVAEAGAFTVAFGGGEPLSRPDLGRLAEHARSVGLTPVVTTSGIGMTEARARSMRAFAQVNVSYDGAGADYEAVRGYDGAPIAERAMALLADAGIPYGVNVVLTRRSFPRLADTIARAEALGAVEAQLLRYKPAGRARDASYLAARLSPEQVGGLYPLLERLVRTHQLGIRVDCAMVPLLSAAPISAETLARFGVFGCEAGRHLKALRVDGLEAPCSFGPAATGDELATWSAPHQAEPCASCDLRAVCRGGCRVVAEHLVGALTPDPECPRVRAHAARQRG